MTYLINLLGAFQDGLFAPSSMLLGSGFFSSLSLLLHSIIVCLCISQAFNSFSLIFLELLCSEVLANIAASLGGCNEGGENGFS